MPKKKNILTPTTKQKKESLPYKKAPLRQLSGAFFVKVF